MSLYAAPPRWKKSRAFTLVELLAVMAIIGVLALLVMAAIGKARSNAQRSQCLANLRQLHTGVALYAQDNRGLIVPNLPVLSGGVSITWVQAVAVYMGMNRSLFDPIEVRPVAPFSCPTSVNVTKAAAKSDFSKNYQANGTASGTLRLTGAASPAQLILFGDSQSQADAGYCGRDLALGTNIRPTGRHDGRANVLYFDGHVVALDPASLPSDLTRLPWNPAATN